MKTMVALCLFLASLMIDRQGKVAYVHVGYGEDSTARIVDAVNKLLAQPATPGT